MEVRLLAGLAALFVAITFAATAAETESAPDYPIVLEGHVGEARGVAFSPDGRTLASAGQDGTVRLWDIATGEETTRFNVGWQVGPLAFSPNGRWLIVGPQYRPGGPRSMKLRDFETERSLGSVKLWDFETGEERIISVAGDVTAVAFSGDSSRVLIVEGVQSARVRVLEVESGAMLHQHWHQFSTPFYGDISNCGTRIVSGGINTGAVVRNIETGEVISTFLTPDNPHVTGAVFSADGERLLIGRSVLSPGFVIWNIQPRRVVISAQSPLSTRAPTTEVFFLRDDRDVGILVVDIFAIWRLADVLSGERAILGGPPDGHLPTGGVLVEPENPLIRMAVSRDGNLIAGARENGEVLVWGNPVPAVRPNWLFY